jgi:uncharacterized membrane protein
MMVISFTMLGWQVGVHWTYPLPADNVFFGGMFLIMGMLFAVSIILSAVFYPLRNPVEKLLRHTQRHLTGGPNGSDGQSDEEPPAPPSIR